MNRHNRSNIRRFATSTCLDSYDGTTRRVGMAADVRLRARHGCYNHSSDSLLCGSLLIDADGQTHRERTAFSMLELIIVMAILAGISAMAAPQLMSMIRESAVYEAADQVRGVLGDTRRFAIDTGIDYEFRYEVSGTSIVVLPSENELNLNESDNTSTTTGDYMRLSFDLPESLRLRAAADTEEVSERIEPERFGSLAGNQLAQKSWSAPVMFRFDGTAQDFELRVSDEAGLTSRVTLRGLTGSARISAVYRESE